jgi:transcriptional regulator of heat shock response
MGIGMVGREIDSRKGDVLRAVVIDYIRTGEPVGSGAIVRRYRLGVSPATIRNDMSALEDLGYLVQPHTSAGRIPTDRGYRFYVDSLPHRAALSEAQRRAIATFFGEPPTPLEEVLRRTAWLLSKLTSYGAVTQPPDAHHVFIGGAANIASEETFERRETVQHLFEVLEEQEDALLAWLRSLCRAEDVAVRIGHENPLAAMQEISLVVSPYRIRGRSAGTIAVIGPTRMQYPTAISAVQAVARKLSDLAKTRAG